MADHESADDGPVILIDGVCSLCSNLARLLIRHERTPIARFAALQSQTGRRLLESHGLPVDDLDTMVLIDDATAYTRSDAALRAARLMRAPWSWLALLRILPVPVRDWAYNRVARHRYRIWGRRDACAVPEGVDRDRFIDVTPLDTAQAETTNAHPSTP